MSALDAYPDLIAAKVDKELISTGRAGCRPGGITVGLYNTPGKPGVSLATPKPSGVEREWAASAGHYVPEPPPVKTARQDPLSSDSTRYFGNIGVGHQSKFGATASRKGR